MSSPEEERAAERRNRVVGATALRAAPAVARNREAIGQLLRGLLPSPARVLEIASGTGEHAVWFAGELPDVIWQPTDRDGEALASIAAWRDHAGLANVLPPLLLEAEAPESWPAGGFDAVVAINMIHIAPWSATAGLMRGAARVLEPGGLLYLYGPFRTPGVPLAPSNAAFDADLRARDAAWGIRDIEAVAEAAAAQGLSLVETTTMPANNLSLVFHRD